MAGLSDLGPWIDRIADALALPSTTEYALRLCVEEAVANVVMHGGAADAETLSVRLSAGNAALQITIEDPCVAFDPLAAPPPPGNQPGGQGIRLMRQYARRVSYRRKGDTNRLTLTIARG